MATAVFILTAYLIGSLSFAVIVSRAFALPDPRSYGSGNPGATNVLRTGKKLAALLTLIGDGGKGWVAVFLGHIFPVFFRFKGGKGVSTAGGILLAVNPWLGVAAIATWIVVALFFRYSSLASIVSAVFAPLYYFFLFGAREVLPALIIMAALLVWRHKANILKLVAGEERRIGEKRDSASAR